MIRIYMTAILAFLVVHCTFYSDVRAELIQLDTGETIQADILQITDTQLKLRHKILGEIVIPRDRVHSIIMAAPKAVKKTKPASTDTKSETPAEVVNRLTNKDFGPQAVKSLEQGAKRQGTVEDAVEQLRCEGVDPQLTDRLNLMLPGFGAPEVQSYFNGRVQGLMDGSLSVQNIREDAINARDQLHSLMEDLGPDAAALQGYYGILDNFIQKTAPREPQTKPTSPSSVQATKP